MANNTNIEWCDLTINPIIGCSKCSPGCDNCYAERWAKRMVVFPATKKAYSQVMENGRWNGQTYFEPTCFGKLPQKPARIFVGSMGDVFHETVSQMQIDALFNMMSKWPQHTFMLLTKRARRMRDMVADILNRYPDKSGPWVLPNVWLGVTAENQAMADERIPFLLATPAAKRFVSVEPMLGPIDLQKAYPDDYHHCDECGWHGHGNECPYVCIECDQGDFPGWDGEGDVCKNGHDGYGQNSCPRCGNTGDVYSIHCVHELHDGDFDFPGLDWVICGGESGPDARPMGLDWARSLRDQCRAARVPFFMKQVSGKKPIPADLMVREFPGE